MSPKKMNEVQRRMSGQLDNRAEGADPLVRSEVVKALETYIEKKDSREVDQVSVGRSLALAATVAFPVALEAIAIVSTPVIVPVLMAAPLAIVTFAVGGIMHAVTSLGVRKLMLKESQNADLTWEETKDFHASLKKNSKLGLWKSVASIFRAQKAYAVYENAAKREKVYYEFVYRGLKVTRVNKIVATSEETVWDNAYLAIRKANIG